MFVSLVRLCVVYVVKEVASFRGAQALSQLMGVVPKRTCTRAVTDQQEDLGRM